MYITKVLSYKGAWETLQREHAVELEDVIKVLKDFDRHLKARVEITRHGKSIIYNSPAETSTMFSFLMMKNQGWSDVYKSPQRIAGVVDGKIGAVKNKISANILSESHDVITWLYQSSLLAIKREIASIPIVIFFCDNSKTPIMLDEDFSFTTFEKASNQIEHLLPLSQQYPFLIFGISLKENPIEITELPSVDDLVTQRVVYDRCLEFPPEYRQAGISILSYFSSVLDEKYPEQKAKVRIEQNGLNVRMVVEAENGNKEVIEKALHDYGLVVTGQASPDGFFLSPIKAVELKTQLRLFEIQVESQRDIIALQHGEIKTLREIANNAILKPAPPIHINLNNQLANTNHNSNTQTNTFNLNLKSEIREAYQDIERLLDLPLDDSLKAKLEGIQTQLDQLKNASQEEVREAGVMSKLKKLLEDAQTLGSGVNGILNNCGESWGHISKLGETFHNIAKWAGFN